MRPVATLTEGAAREAMIGSGPVENVTFPVGFRWDRQAVHRRFSAVDLSSAQIAGGFLSRVLFDGCDFEDVLLPGTSLRKVEFRGCSFLRVVFGPKALTPIERTVFLDCRFDQVVMSDVNAVESRFERCDFRAFDGRRIRFRESQLIDTAISGTMITCNFVSCELRNVDLSAAELSDIGLVKNDFNGVSLPDRTDNFFVPPGLFRAAANSIAEELTPKSRTTLLKLAQIVGTSSAPVECVHRSQFDSMSELEVDTILGALHPCRVLGPQHARRP